MVWKKETKNFIGQKLLVLILAGRIFKARACFKIS